MRRRGSVSRYSCGALSWAGLLILGFSAACTSGAFAGKGESARNGLTLTWVLIILGTVVYVVTGAVALTALRRHPAHQDAHTREGFDHRMIVAGGIVVPAVILLGLLVLNITTLAAQPRNGRMTVQVEGFQYWWEVRYPQQGVVTANEIHVPTGERVRLELTTHDVIHSFWVPELAGKRDLIPGRRNVLVIEADRPGTYRGQCAEFCGLQHANMAMFVIAHAPGDFQRWLRDNVAPAGTPAEMAQQRGLDTFMQNCAGCHTIRGTGADGQKGPDLTHFASRRTIGAGTVPNDRGRLGGWVANAQSTKPGSLMPPIPIPADRLNDLLDYLESLR
ncbi:MAG: cytochrome c oxidase subunit II [Egibacteraceae bacterium]